MIIIVKHSIDANKEKITSKEMARIHDKLNFLLGTGRKEGTDMQGLGGLAKAYSYICLASYCTVNWFESL